MTNQQVLEAVAAGKLSPIEAAKMISTPGPAQPLRCKVSEKQALSVYGLNRQWPVTLYVEQWERLIAFIPQLQEFAKANAEKLARKG